MGLFFPGKKRPKPPAMEKCETKLRYYFRAKKPEGIFFAEMVLFFPRGFFSGGKESPKPPARVALATFCLM